MQLDDTVARSMAMGRVFKDNNGRVNSLDFHRTEDVLITAGDDDSIHLYDVQSGTRKKTIFSKKHGASNVCFTHHVNALIYASNKGSDHALRYLSLHDNKYLRYFKGHTGKVTCLSISPKNDLFMSAAMDKHVRLWDLRTNVCQGLLPVPGQPTVAFDQQGLVFCVGTESGILKLYDARNYEKGPFDNFALPEEANCPVSFTHVRFSPDGKLLLAVAESRIYLLDAYDGTVRQRMSNGTPEGGTPFEASFSPDGQYVTSGCEDRAVRMWSVHTGQVVATLLGHAGLPACLKWSPRRLVFASACNSLALWIPDLSRLQQHVPQQQPM